MPAAHTTVRRMVTAERQADEPSGFEVADVPERNRFELRRDGAVVGFATYRTDGNAVVVPHVETLPEHRGQGFANRLLDGLTEMLADDGRMIVPVCPFAAEYYRAHPEHRVVVRGG